MADSDSQATPEPVDNDQHRVTQGGITTGDSSQFTVGTGDLTGRDKLTAGENIVIAKEGATVIIGGEKPGPSPTEAPVPGFCPFKGLRAFHEEDAEFFFGREALTAQLVDLLRISPSPDLVFRSGEGAGGWGHFLAVVGPSGSGKSSLVRAGLVPALRRGALPGSETWRIHTITPTARPLESLAASLTREADSLRVTANLIDDLKGDHRSLHLAARKALSSEDTDARLMLVVDQLEELFTLCYDEDERKQFITNLLYAVNATDGQTIIILTLRADFYPRCALYPGLRQQITQPQVLVGPMDEVELHRAIEAPAERTGWKYEAGLVNTILADVASEPGALPLLQHALLETWGRRRGKTLTLEGYQASGGVRGAIAQRAEMVYTGLTPDAQAIVRRIMLRLTRPGEGTGDTRRRTELTELIYGSEDESIVREVLKILADTRLITIDEKSIDVAHEALIQGWPRFRQWLDQDRAALHIRHHLTESAKTWERLNRDEGELYRGARLAQVSEWVKEAHARGIEVNPLEFEFLANSYKLQITEEKKAKDLEGIEEERLHLSRTLEQFNKTTSDFINIASHELRTPLTKIRGYTDILAEMNHDNTIDTEHIDMVTSQLKKASDRLEEVVTQMLDVSQLDVKAMRLTFLNTSVDAILRIASDGFNQALKERRLTLTIQGATTLPSIQGDFQRLVQAFREVIGNAVKFTPDGGCIDIYANHLPANDEKERPDVVEIVVADTGVGIDRQYQALIFEKFFRVGGTFLYSTSKSKFMGGGPGLGLTIARGLITMHSGQIWVESAGFDREKCPGTQVHIVLPVYQQKVQD